MIAIVLSTVLWGTTGTAATLLPGTVSPLATGAATAAIDGLLLAASASRASRAVAGRRGGVRGRLPAGLLHRDVPRRRGRRRRRLPGHGTPSSRRCSNASSTRLRPGTGCSRGGWSRRAPPCSGWRSSPSSATRAALRRAAARPPPAASGEPASSALTSLTRSSRCRRDHRLLAVSGHVDVRPATTDRRCHALQHPGTSQPRTVAPTRPPSAPSACSPRAIARSPQHHDRVLPTPDAHPVPHLVVDEHVHPRGRSVLLRAVRPRGGPCRAAQRTHLRLRDRVLTTGGSDPRRGPPATSPPAWSAGSSRS